MDKARLEEIEAALVRAGKSPWDAEEAVSYIPELIAALQAAQGRAKRAEAVVDAAVAYLRTETDSAPFVAAVVQYEQSAQEQPALASAAL